MLVQSVVDQAGKKTVYSYDEADRLVKARTTNSSGSLIEEYRYVFDSAGNRMRKEHEKPTGTTTTSYGYDETNRLCWTYRGAASTSSCANAPTDAQMYEYDAQGNQLDNGYDGAGYDVFNRNTQFNKSYLNGNPPATLSYLSPTNGELVGYGNDEFSVAYRNNMLGVSSQHEGSTATYYTREPDGKPFSQRSGTSKQYMLSDQLGSTVGLVEGSGSIVREYAYNPDGQTTTSGSGAQTDLRFAGGHVLPNGLQHYGASYYDPTIAGGRNRTR